MTRYITVLALAIGLAACAPAPSDDIKFAGVYIGNTEARMYYLRYGYMWECDMTRYTGGVGALATICKPLASPRNGE